MALRTLARMSILAVVFLVTSAFGQTVTFTWPSCSSIPSGFSGVCQNADLSMTFVWASTQTFPPPILPLPYDSSGAAFITGPSSVGNGLVPQFTAGTGKLSSSGLQVGNIVASTNSVNLPESRITNLTSDLASKQPLLPAKGSVTTGTTTINANTCSGPSTLTITGVTSSSNFNFTPTSDTSAVVGWGSTGGLRFTYWPTANTVNYYVCNVTGSAITPGASVTWNVSVQ